MSTAPVVIANFVTVTFVHRVTKITRRIALATCALSTQRPVKILFIHQITRAEVWQMPQRQFEPRPRVNRIEVEWPWPADLGGGSL